MEPRGDRFLIWGAGGHGKVVADLVRALRGQVAGFVDADPDKVGTVVEPCGARVVFTQREFLSSILDRHALPVVYDAVALAVGNNSVRLECMRRIAGLELPKLVHPSAVISPSVSVGKGTVVMASVAVNAGAKLGDAVIVNTGAIIEHDCEIGDGAHVSPGAVLAGGVAIGERSWIGAGAVVIQQVTIGPDVVVGAGAVVLDDVPGGTTVVGNPARILKSR